MWVVSSTASSSVVATLCPWHVKTCTLHVWTCSPQVDGSRDGWVDADCAQTHLHCPSPVPPCSSAIPLARPQMSPSEPWCPRSACSPRDPTQHPRAPLPFSRKHRSAPKEKCTWCLSLWGLLGDTPPIRNRTFLGPKKAPEGTNTKVTSARGPFCAYPTFAARVFAARAPDWGQGRKRGPFPATGMPAELLLLLFVLCCARRGDTKVKSQVLSLESGTVQNHMLTQANNARWAFLHGQRIKIRPISLLTLWVSEGLTPA